MLAKASQDRIGTLGAEFVRELFVLPAFFDGPAEGLIGRVPGDRTGEGEVEDAGQSRPIVVVLQSGGVGLTLELLDHFVRHVSSGASRGGWFQQQTKLVDLNEP